MADEALAASTASDRRSIARRAVAAATIGNALEFYDFITFAFFAIQIGKTFFPSDDPYTSLMGSLATFGAGFISRPIGAWVLGGYADRHGRKPVMLFSMVLMGLSIATMALTPGYATIGVAAPVIVVLARLAQGFALGGEVGSATIYMLEAVDHRRRGFSVSWQGASQGIASSAGPLVGMGLTYVLTDAQLTAFGWRIALLLGVIIVPFAILIRRSLPETLEQPQGDVQQAVEAPKAKVDGYARVVVLGLLMIGSGTIATYIFQYMATFGQLTLGLSTRVSLAGEFVHNGVTIGAVLLGGWLSDHYGRRGVLIWPTVIFVASVIPLFEWLVTSGTAFAFLVANALFSLFQSLPRGAIFAAISESLPTGVRARAFALIYSIPVTVLGGTTQLVVTWILKVTGNPMAIAWYLTAVSAIGLVAMMFMRESAPVKLRGV